MENLDKKVGMCGDCGMCGGHGGKHHLIKIILKLIIVMLIFFFGFKLGLITGSIGGNYGRGAFDRDGGWGMMGKYYKNIPATGTNPVIPPPIPAQ